MATKSILKTVHIKDPKAARRLANAVEHASGKKSQKVTIERAVSQATREEICAMFSKYSDRA